MRASHRVLNEDNIMWNTTGIHVASSMKADVQAALAEGLDSPVCLTFSTEMISVVLNEGDCIRVTLVTFNGDNNYQPYMLYDSEGNLLTGDALPLISVYTGGEYASKLTLPVVESMDNTLNGVVTMDDGSYNGPATMYMLENNYYLQYNGEWIELDKTTDAINYRVDENGTADFYNADFTFQPYGEIISDGLAQQYTSTGYDAPYAFPLTFEGCEVLVDYADLVGLKAGSAEAYVAGEVVDLEAPVVTLTVPKADGVKETAKTNIPSFFFDTNTINDTVFYAPVDLIKKIDTGAQITFYNEGAQAVIVLSDDTEIRVNGLDQASFNKASNKRTVANAQLIIDGRLVRLEDSVLYMNGTIYLPVKSFTEIVLGKCVVSDADNGTIALSDKHIAEANDVNAVFASSLEEAAEGMTAPAHTLITENVPLMPASITANEIGDYITSTAANDLIGDGLDHEWCEYVPASYDPDKPTTLLVYLHGNGGRGMNYLSRDKSYRYLAELNNIILIFPSSTAGGIQPATQKPSDPAKGGAWEEVFRIPEDTNKDLKFLNGLIDYAIEKFNIDESRIFMGGFSNGDLMTNRFAASKYGIRLAGFISGGGAVHYSSAWTDNPLENMDRLDEIEASPVYNVPVYQHRGSNDVSALTVNEYGDRNPHIIDPVAEGQKMASSNEYAKQMWLKKNEASQLPEISIVGVNNYEIYRSDKGDVLFQSQHGDPHDNMVDAAQTAYDQLLNRYTRDPETHELTDNGAVIKGDEGAVALVAGASKAYIDNKVVELSGEVIREDGLIYMPVDVLSKGFGGSAGSTVITLGGRANTNVDTKFTKSAGILSNEVVSGSKSSIDIVAGKDTVTVDGVTIKLDAPVISKDGILYVPAASFANKVLGRYTTEAVDAIYISDHAGIMNYATYYTLYRILDEDFGNFVAMSNIMGIPTEGYIGQEIDLNAGAVIFPVNATKTLKDVQWSVYYGDTKGMAAGATMLTPEQATIVDGKLVCTAPGIVRVTARVDSGTGTGVDDISARFLQNFDIVIKEAPDTYATDNGSSLSLKDKISINIYVGIPEEAEGWTAKLFYEKNGFEEPVSTYALDKTAANGYSSKNDEYKFAYSEISAKEMTENVRVQIFDENGKVVLIQAKDGTFVEALDFCAADWANTMISDTSRPEKTVNLAKALLNYGGEAQTYFEYKTEDNANADGHLADKMAAITAADLSAFAPVKDDKTAAVGENGISLSLKSETYLNVYYTKEVTATAENLNGAKIAVSKSGKEWVAKITGITAKNLGNMYTLTVKAGDVTSVQKYSALSWAYNILNGTNEKAKPLAKALYLYQQAAVEYFGN